MKLVRYIHSNIVEYIPQNITTIIPPTITVFINELISSIFLFFWSLMYRSKTPFQPVFSYYHDQQT